MDRRREDWRITTNWQGDASDPDRDLVARAKSDRQAFTALYDRYLDRV